MFFHGLIRQERERIMKRSINVIFGGMLAALVSVSAAWAGSAASVNQTGDDGVTLVVQSFFSPSLFSSFNGLVKGFSVFSCLRI